MSALHQLAAWSRYTFSARNLAESSLLSFSSSSDQTSMPLIAHLDNPVVVLMYHVEQNVIVGKWSR